MVDDDTTEQMKAFGHWLERQRLDRGLTKRAAAAKAGISEGAWRQYEQGGKDSYGTWVPANPSDSTLSSIALGLELPHEEVFKRAGRPAPLFGVHTEDGGHPESGPGPDREALISAYGHLSPGSRAAVDALITQLLKNEGLDPDDPDTR